MNCPKCGHLVSEHSENGCNDFFGAFNGFGDGVADDCNCNLSEAQALLAAQRRAAAVQLWKLDKAYRMALEIGLENNVSILSWRIFDLQNFIRGSGIQRKRRSER